MEAHRLTLREVNIQKETIMEKEKLNNNALSDVAGGEESEQNGDKCPNCGSTNTTMDLAVLMHYVNGKNNVPVDLS